VFRDYTHLATEMLLLTLLKAIDCWWW